MKLAVLGGGPGGYIAAIRAAQLGMEVTLIEEDKNLGGTCLNRGCIPTKALVEASMRFKSLQEAAGFGLELGQSPVVDLAKVQERKNALVRRLAMGTKGLVERNGVKIIQGHGRLVSDHTLEVDGQVLEFDAMILATGSRTATPKFFPIDGRRVITSDHILNLTELPKSMIVVGSGAVGMEFASIFAAFGTKISLIELAPRIMPLEDHEISSEMQRLCRKAGWRIFTGAKTEKIEVTSEGVKVTGEGLAAADEPLQAEIMLVAIGRTPNLEDVGLDKVGVELTERGRVKVDQFMRTSVANIYAIGDIVPTPQLAHMASAEGILAVEHLAGLTPRTLNASHCPAATYCDPEVASVGLTQEQAESQGRSVKVGKFPFAALGKAAIGGHTDGFVKVVAACEGEDKPHLILGVHILGAHACDLIAEGALALEKGATLEDIAHTIHPHPSLSESVAEAAHQALGAPLNFLPPPKRRGR